MPLPWDNARFQKFREAYQTPGGRKWLETVIGRSEPYAQYVAERIRWYGLPEELFFLPMIESEWSPRAVSRSGASGLWQFMRNSIGGYDMRVNEWVDERRDFMKSTDAALKKLRDNYDALGSWEMALAAYNCGLGAAMRATVRGGSRDYWELCDKGLLPAQTASYVPKYLAIVSLLSRRARNGFALPENPPVEWECVELDKPVDISLLAEASGVSLSDLRAGNMELRYNVTPPEGKYALKVPAKTAPSVREVLARPDFKAMRYYLYKIRSGDTLSALAEHYEVSIALIAKFNPGVKPSLLKIGSTLVIPALKDKKPYVSAPSPGDSLDFSSQYVVAKGDTLWSISLRYGVQPETLAQKNGLDISSIIREGMALKVPRME
jgi:membrane-bound lytic murein transglycosylase D